MITVTISLKKHILIAMASRSLAKTAIINSPPNMISEGIEQRIQKGGGNIDPTQRIENIA